MKKKILIIEDDKETQRVYFDALSRDSFDVYFTDDGQEGLRISAEKRPNLILLDIMLPGKLNGFDVLEKIKKDESLKEIPVVVLTNLGSEKKVAKEIGAADYFIKANTDLDDILKRIREILN
jgi:DNA-binding response OmpR family regulator